MNRRVVRYSAFASVAVAVVLGIVYFVFLNGSQADDGSAGGSIAATQPAKESAESEGSKGPDALFNEQVRVWDRPERPAANDPFPQYRSDIVQTAYGDAEPRRLAPNSNANPLRSADVQELDDRASHSAQLAAAGVSAANDNAASAADSRTDPFGLRSAPYGGPSPLRAIDPAPLQESPANAGAGKAASAELQSVLGRSGRDGAGTTANRGAANATSRFDRDRVGSDNSATRSAPVQPGGRYESPSADSGQINGYAPDDAAIGDVAEAQVESIGQAHDTDNRLPPGSIASDGALSGAGRHSGSVRNTSPDDPAPLAAIAGATGSGRPGSRQVEGKQVPQITIEKTAPQEIQVGKPARFELHLRNTGTVVAQDVEVHDFVPEGTQFLSANPPATPGAQGELVWSLGALKPGDQTTIEVELTPITEGEAGSVAFVTLRAEAGARSRITKPDLTLQVTAAKQVMIGQEVQLSVKIANPGTGPATGVVIEERVPPGLKHAAGAELEFEVGTLKPGETRDLELTLTAAQAGHIVNQIAARGEGNLQAQAQCELEVIAPALAITMDGPGRRYLERQATYTVSVSNPGTAPAKDVELVTRLPRGLKFVKANNAGHYDPQTHAVLWSLEELPPDETGTVMLTALPIEPGEQRLRAEGRAKQNLSDEQEQITVVEGLAALLFEVIDVADPIEVKGETQYEIRIMNQGSKAADNVQLAALLPPELKFVSADGPTRHAIKGQHVIFEPLARLAPKADTMYRIAVQGVQPGDVRMKVQVMADDLRQPITKEESTRVYSDE